jgi:outer membrane protein OmpA-like peptidoglycan-associated protein
LINKDEKSGYISSNRPGGKGKDDIYRFESPFKMITTESSSQLVEVTIKVLEKLTFLPILESEISLSEFDINNSFTNEFGNVKVIKQDGSKEILVKMDANMKNNKTFTTKNGEVALNLYKNTNYLISINAKGFEEETLIFKADNKNDNLTFVLNPISVEIIEGNEELSNKEIISIPTKIGSIIVFENIYYNYNSTDILVEAAGELDLLYESMVANPTMKIQLSSHTDSRGTFLYNKELSIKRATSAKNYLVKKGIAESRIKTIGFGESRIRNHCSDGVICTEEEHAYNRRTEVLVIE